MPVPMPKLCPHSCPFLWFPYAWVPVLIAGAAVSLQGAPSSTEKVTEATEARGCGMQAPVGYASMVPGRAGA